MPRRHHRISINTKLYKAMESGIRKFEIDYNVTDHYRKHDMVVFVEVVEGYFTGRELSPVEIIYVEEAEGFTIFNW